MSFHAFHGHSGSGMTRNEIETEWQGWGRNDDFSHSEHIPIIPVIPDVWEKCCLSWFHPYHSSLIPSFWCHSKIPFQLEWCWNDEWFWAEVDYFPLSFTGFNFPAATIRQNCNKIYEYVFLKDFGTPTFHSYAINVSLLIDDGSPKDGDVTSLTFKAQQFTRYLQPLNRVLKKSAKIYWMISTLSWLWLRLR